MITRVSGKTKEVLIGDGRPTVLIGERINPAGKKKLAEALRTGNLDLVREEAQRQVAAGADIIDVAVGTFGVDEVALLPRVVKLLQEAVEAPLCLDSHNVAALEGALKVYSGKALVNSVTGEEQSLREVLPLVGRFGAAVVGLLQSDEGIPKTPDQRLAVARKIVERAEAAGVSRDNIVIDCLALAVGADATSGQTTLETIRRVRQELGVNITLGASNVSFGMPDREPINNAYVAMVLAAGATCLIVDVGKIRPAILAADMVLGRDERARRYIGAYRQRAREKQ